MTNFIVGMIIIMLVTSVITGLIIFQDYSSKLKLSCKAMNYTGIYKFGAVDINCSHVGESGEEKEEIVKKENPKR